MKWPWVKKVNDEKLLLQKADPKPTYSQLVKDWALTGHLDEMGKTVDQAEEFLKNPEHVADVKEFIRLHESITKQRIQWGITDEEFNVLLQIPNANIRHKVTEYLVKIHEGGAHKYSELGYSLDYLLKHPDKLIKIAENPELDKALDNNKTGRETD